MFGSRRSEGAIANFEWLSFGPESADTVDFTRPYISFIEHAPVDGLFLFR